MRAAPCSLALAALLSVGAAGTAAQQPSAARPALTTQDYARAEQMLSWKTTPLVFGASVRPMWLEGDRFWYRNATPAGARFVTIDPDKRTRTVTDSAPVTPGGAARDAGRNVVASPDGKLGAFIRNENLWVRDLASGRETQLTTDGVKDFGYATDNAGWIHSDRPILLWSPDSRKIATFQQDQRGVGDMYLVETKVGHPVLQAWKYPLPGDSVVAMIHRVVIDLDGPRVIRLQMPPDQHRSTLCDHIACGGAWADVEWTPDASKLVFVSTSRNHQQEQLRVADAATGAVREVYQETVPTFFESGNGRINWHALPATNEFIWYS